MTQCKIILTYQIDVPGVDAVLAKYHPEFHDEIRAAFDGKNHTRLADVAQYCKQKIGAVASSARVVEPKKFGIDELRRAVDTLGFCNETVLQEIGAVECVLNVARAMSACGWDLYPDEWTPQQVDAAANHGTVPRFEEKNGWIHALDVTDCNCRTCRDVSR